MLKVLLSLFILFLMFKFIPREQEKFVMGINAEVILLLACITSINLFVFWVKNKQKLKSEEKQQEILNQLTQELLKKETVVKELHQELENLKSSNDRGLTRRIYYLNQLTSSILLTADDWCEFKIMYEQVHTGFFAKIKDRFPDLSQAEIRLCALIKLNMNTKEMAVTLAISPESVNKARYRLRKKLGIALDETLENLIVNI